jgi:purine-binding chemotaxis protein CheW
MTGEQLALLQIEAAGTRLLLAAGALLEVVARPDLTHVPAMPLWVSGIANLRGVVLTVIDLAPRLGLGPAAVTDRSCLLVLEGAQGQAYSALGADRVGQLHIVDASAIERLPQAGLPVPAELCLGMSRVTGELLPVLDAVRLLDLNGAAA